VTDTGPSAQAAQQPSDQPSDPELTPSAESGDENENKSDNENDEAEFTRRAPVKERRRVPFWVELPALVATALILTFLIQTFVARVYIIPSPSMEQTLDGHDGVGDRILVDEVVYDFHDPRPGDVVVFRGPDSWVPTEYQVSASTNPVLHWLKQFGAAVGIGKPDEYDLVKRVIAVGGQTVYCCDAQNHVVVDGKPLDEPYVYWEPDRGGPAQQLRFAPVTIPAGYLWMMGDNRNDSDDSRIQNGGGINGIVPVANVIGKARTIIWPPSRWRGVGDDDAQLQALALPGWTQGLPAGVGIAAAWPTLWLGRRVGHRLRRWHRSAQRR
jgi:signal peptidase I